MAIGVHRFVVHLEKTCKQFAIYRKLQIVHTLIGKTISLLLENRNTDALADAIMLTDD